MENDHITRHIEIDAKPSDVWRAVSDASAFGKWFRVALDGPFEVGKTTTGAMTYPGHEGVRWISVTEVLEPESRFVFRWPHLLADEEIGPDTIWLTVSITLEPAGTGTRLTVTETGFAALPEDQRVSMLRDNEQGWDIQTLNVKNYVEG
ncbi:MAG: SRPBCC family protein [Pseudomonadota bacterium]